MKQIFGTGGIDAGKLHQAIVWAAENGYELFDTAWLYENEAAVGKAIAEVNKAKGLNCQIQTKIDPRFNDDVKAIFAKQLAALGVKKVHTLLLHRPDRNFERSIKAWKALIDLKKEGKVQRIGVSNFDRDMLEILWKETGTLPEVNQIELAVTNYRKDRVQFCQTMGIEVQAWRPNGVDGLALQDELVIKLAQEKGVTPSQIALAYLIEKKIVPVVRSASEHHIQENFAANQVKMTQKEQEDLFQRNRFLSRSSETFDHPYAKEIYYAQQAQSTNKKPSKKE